MSTLGAQARAAELAAAVSAQERMKVYREMEAQALGKQINFNVTDAMAPPKNPSVSLGAFMKPAPPNRNKGAKAWKPFDGGSFDDSSEDDIPCEKMEVDTTSTISNSSITSSNGTPKLTTEPKPNVVSTGPRVMRLNIPQRTIPQHRHSSLSAAAPPPSSLVPVFPPRQPTASHIATPAGLCPTQESPTSLAHKFGPVPTATKLDDKYLVPDDLSPTKQENKISALKAQQEESKENFFDNRGIQDVQQVRNPPYIPMYGIAFTESPSCYQHYTSAQAHRKGVSWDNESAYLMAASYHNFRGFGNDGFANPTRLGHIMNGSNDPSRQRPEPNQQPYDTRAAMQKFLTEQIERSKTDRGKTVLCNPELYKGINRDCQSIQDIQEIQRKVNTSSPIVSQQRASSSPSNMLDPFITPTRIFSEPTRSNRIDFLKTAASKDSSQPTLPGSTAISDPSPPKIPSDFVCQQLQSASKHDENFSDSIGPIADKDDRALGEGRDLPASFFDLRPMTAAERKKTQACMAKAAKAVGRYQFEAGVGIENNDRQKERGTGDSGFMVNDPAARHNAIAQLMNTDHRGQAELRAYAQRISVAHAVKQRDFAAAIAACQANSTSNLDFNDENHIAGYMDLPFGYRLGIDDSLASNIALGDIACNLGSYLTSSDEENQLKFNRVREVPEWCTERRSNMWAFNNDDTSNNSSIFINRKGETEADGEGHSYFGGSWGIPPPRVARDPRFHAHAVRANVAGSDMGMSAGVGVDMGTGIGVGMGGGVGIRGMSALEHERRRLLEGQMGRRPATMI